MPATGIALRGRVGRADHTGAVIAALSLSGRTAHLPDSEQESQLELLRAAAAEASQWDCAPRRRRGSR